jgi:hypothetical protein
VPGPGHPPELSVVCPSCATHFHPPNLSADDDKAAKPLARGEEETPVEQAVPGESAVAVAARPTKKAKSSGVGACLMGCVALGFVAVIALVAVGVGIRYWLGQQFVDDLLILARGVQTPPKSLEPKGDAEAKPEPKELPDRLIGAWGGDLPNGNRVTLVYREKGECTIVQHRGKQTPILTLGTWKVTGVDGATLRIHREFNMPASGEAFAADVTITFPAPNEMEHSLGKGTIRCKRE